jgi:hypothetical protein
MILENMSGLLQLIPNRLRTRKKIIDQLPRFLSHNDKHTLKLILVGETVNGITTSQDVPNIFRILINTKLLANGR